MAVDITIDTKQLAEVARNKVVNPVPAAVGGVFPGWGAIGGPMSAQAGYARLTMSTQFTSNAIPRLQVVGIPGSVPVGGGQPFFLRAEGRNSKGKKMRISAWFLNAAGTYISATAGAQEVANATSWTPVTVSGTTPANAAYMGWQISTDSSAEPAEIGDWMDIRHISTYDGAYFDGDTPASGEFVYRWAGAPHDSPSIKLKRKLINFRNVSTYSVTEDSSPTNPADSTGGFGYINFSSVEEPMDRLLLGKTLDLEDGINGTTQGTITNVSSTDGALSVAADSRLALLKVERQVAPYEGDLAGAFEYYFDLVGINERVVIDPSLASVPVKFIGWYGDLWEYVNKQLCSVFGVEIALVSDNVVVRPVRQNVATNKRDTSLSWSVNKAELAQSVEVYCYNPTTITNQLVYPYGGWNPDLQIYQVEAGEELVVEIPVDVSLTQVTQPVVQDYVSEAYTSTSVYSVVGGDGKPFPAQQWLDMGGSLTVEIGEDTQSLIVTIKGPMWEQNSPYRIAAASGSSGNYYSTLRIIGRGIGFNKELISVLTGVTPEESANLVGVTIDNPFIDTPERAYDAASKAVKQFSKPSHTLNVTSTGINREGSSGNVRYPTYAEFKEMFTGITYAEWKTERTGQTYAQLRDELYQLVRDDFDNQAFGNVAGARVQIGDSWYRIRTATTTETQVTYSAESDTLYEDLKPLWTGSTYGDWKTQWAGKTYEELSLMPLRKE